MFLLILCRSIQAQVTISLEQAANYLDTPDGIPEDVTYVKDINNKLPVFVGIWSGISEGKIIELHLNQFLHLPKSTHGFKIDQIAGRLLIKDQNTYEVLYNTLNITDNEKTSFIGFYFINGAYVMNFSNNNDTSCLDIGEVYISVNASTLVNMTLNFYRSQDIIIEGKCPNFDTYVPILPKTVRLVKQ